MYICIISESITSEKRAIIIIIITLRHGNEIFNVHFNVVRIILYIKEFQIILLFVAIILDTTNSIVYWFQCWTVNPRSCVRFPHIIINIYVTNIGSLS